MNAFCIIRPFCSKSKDKAMSKVFKNSAVENGLYFRYDWNAELKPRNSESIMADWSNCMLYFLTWQNSIGCMQMPSFKLEASNKSVFFHNASRFSNDGFSTCRITVFVPNSLLILSVKS